MSGVAPAVRKISTGSGLLPAWLSPRAEQDPRVRWLAGDERDSNRCARPHARARERERAAARIDHVEARRRLARQEARLDAAVDLELQVAARAFGARQHEGGAEAHASLLGGESRRLSAGIRGETCRC